MLEFVEKAIMPDCIESFGDIEEGKRERGRASENVGHGLAQTEKVKELGTAFEKAGLKRGDLRTEGGEEVIDKRSNTRLRIEVIEIGR